MDFYDAALEDDDSVALAALNLSVRDGPVVFDEHNFIVLLCEPADGFAFYGFRYGLLDVFEENVVLVADVNGRTQTKSGRGH